MLNLKKAVLLSIFLLLSIGALTANAQMEIRYIDSEKIYMEYKDFQEVMKQVSAMEENYRRELTQKGQALQEKVKDFQAKQLVLSEENKRKIEEDLQKEAAELQKQEYEIFSQNGEYYRKANELRAPLVQKINIAIQRVAVAKGYDLILDKATMGVVFAKDIYDITNVVLEELKKVSGSGK